MSASPGSMHKNSELLTWQAHCALYCISLHLHLPPFPTAKFLLGELATTHLLDMLGTALSTSMAFVTFALRAASLSGRRLTPTSGRPVMRPTSQHRNVPSENSGRSAEKPWI